MKSAQIRLYKMDSPDSPIRKVLLVLIFLPHAQVGDGKAPAGQCGQALRVMPCVRLLGPTHSFLGAGAR